jgi:hypothetical protein
MSGQGDATEKEEYWQIVVSVYSGWRKFWWAEVHRTPGEMQEL